MVLPRVEADHVVAAKLVRDQLALFVANVVVAELPAVGELVVVRGPRRDRALVVRVPDVEAADADGVVVGVSHAEIQHAGRRHGVDRAQLVLDQRLGIGDVALGALAVAPYVVVRDLAQRAETPEVLLAEEPAVPEREIETAIGAELFRGDLDVPVEGGRQTPIDGLGLADGVEVAVAVQAVEDAGRADVAEIRLEPGLQCVGECASSVVESDAVVAAARIRVAVVAAVGVVARSRSRRSALGRSGSCASGCRRCRRRTRPALRASTPSEPSAHR